MKFLRIFLLIASVCLIAFSALWHFGVLKRNTQVKIGDRLPQLRFESLDGSSTVLTPEARRVTFVNVFATWCPPCKAETPDLVAFASSEVGRTVDIIGVDQQETPQAVQLFRQEYHTAYPMLIDNGWTTKDVLGARIIPRTLVIDRNGIVRAIVSGPMTPRQMRHLATAAAAGS